jgi:hypothetical protein
VRSSVTAASQCAQRGAQTEMGTLDALSAHDCADCAQVHCFEGVNGALAAPQTPLSC